MLGSDKDVVGPHVIETTGDVIHLRDRVNGFDGKVREWECKYCGASGVHPDDGAHALTWRQACEEFEILESEDAALRE
jgi:hypothetical protein